MWVYIAVATNSSDTAILKHVYRFEVIQCATHHREGRPRSEHFQLSNMCISSILMHNQDFNLY